MSQKAHGTTENAPDANLRWAADHKIADSVCCFNRHYAEPSGSWGQSNFLTTESAVRDCAVVVTLQLVCDLADWC